MEAIRSACGRHSQLQPATANWRQKHHCQVTPPGWSIQSSCQPCWEQPQATSTCPSPGPSWPWRLWVHFSASVHLAGCPLASASSALINAQLFPLHHCITKGQLLNPCKKKKSHFLKFSKAEAECEHRADLALRVPGSITDLLSDICACVDMIHAER